MEKNDPRSILQECDIASEINRLTQQIGEHWKPVIQFLYTEVYMDYENKLSKKEITIGKHLITLIAKEAREKIKEFVQEFEVHN